MTIVHMLESVADASGLSLSGMRRNCKRLYGANVQSSRIIAERKSSGDQPCKAAALSGEVPEKSAVITGTETKYAELMTVAQQQSAECTNRIEFVGADKGAVRKGWERSARTVDNCLR